MGKAGGKRVLREVDMIWHLKEGQGMRVNSQTHTHTDRVWNGHALVPTLDKNLFLI